MIWTAEADAYLREWYGTERSARQIASHLDCSKNAVIGRARRLKLGGSYKKPLRSKLPEAPPMYRACQWIEGEPTADAPKCGKPVKDGSRFSFCEEHHAICFRKPMTMEEREAVLKKVKKGNRKGFPY